MKRPRKSQEAVWRWEWMGQLVWSPGLFFENIRSAWVWTPGYLVTAAFIAAGTALSYPALHAATEMTLTQQQAPADISRIIQNAWTGGQVISPLIAPFVTPVVFAYFLLFLSLFLSVRVRFGKLFSLAMWSFLPFIGLRHAVQGLITFLSTGMSALSVDLSLAVLLPPDASQIFRVLVGQLDPFYVWSLSLLALGYSKFMRQPLTTGVVCSCIALLGRIALTLSVAT